ncbi:MAG: tRNA lysidine(34) synthetase TilS [Flavobacteriaceae bacterium]|nr:tRNA lysidine(34) synthetase TilS [Flavobacteriaceae bacterium]
MVQKLKEHIATHFSFLKDKKLLIAISGGVDSMVLTHLFAQLNYTIVLAHCNFKLRGIDSDADESFVKSQGKKLGLTTFTTQFDTEKIAKEKKLSVQITARELRYNWFQELVYDNGLDYIATAHHADDNLETFLINLTRKTGLEGLTGIPPVNNNIIRPLLPFSRDEIEAYAQNNKIEWREDKSNASTKYLRNKIRHQVVPVLKEINPNLLNSFQQTLSNLQGCQEIINTSISKIKKKTFDTSKNGIVKIDISAFNKLKNPKPYLFELLKTYGFSEWNDVSNLLTAQSGKEVASKTHRLLKDRETLLLTQLKKIDQEVYFIEKDTNSIKKPLQLNLEYNPTKTTFDVNTIYIDTAKVKFPLTIRKWKVGDYFYPLGMQGKKKVSKFFKDLKFSAIDKENTWLLCSTNQIVWVIGHRQDKRFTSNNNNLAIQVAVAQ